MKKALVLSSGGTDSTTCLAMAVEELGAENVSTVIIQYGQRHSKEVECARKIADHYGVAHYEFDLSDMFKYSDCALLSKSTKDIVHDTYEHQVEAGTKITSYVPFRNGLMLSVCATLAQSLWEYDQVDVYLGNHQSDFAYADCSTDFVKKMNAAIEEGTYGMVHFVSPLQEMSKQEVIAKGLELNAPYELTWSCYEGHEKSCGKCASCLERLAAFEANGVEDPIAYEE